MKGYLVEPNRFELRRFFKKIRIEKTARGCWIWRGARANAGSDGNYGVFGVRGFSTSAHRVSHRWFVSAIDAGFEVDHLCENPRCVNPAHLEAVSKAEHVRRGVSRREQERFCKRGHERTPENLYLRGYAKPVCKVCIRDARRLHRENVELIAQGDRLMERAKAFYAKAAMR